MQKIPDCWLDRVGCGRSAASRTEPAMSNALDAIVNALLWCFLPLCPFLLYTERRPGSTAEKNGQVKLPVRQSTDRNSRTIF
jgi:hypothetical protein